MPDLSQARIRLLYIFFGANDACVKGSQTGQYVPLEKYKINLEKLIRHPTVQAHQPRLFLITPPPINEYQFREFNDFSRTAENTRKYAEACSEVGVKLGVPVLNLWRAIMKRVGWSEGDPLAGSIAIAENMQLRAMLRDGKLSVLLVIL